MLRPLAPFTSMLAAVATALGLVRARAGRVKRGLVGPVLAGLLLTSNAIDTTRLSQTAQRLGPSAVQHTQALLQEMTTLAGADEPEKLKGINHFYNRSVLFRSDQDNWGVVDYWASPIELLNRGQGDCEDYAIGKYFSLIAMGVSPAKMRMVYVRAQTGGTIQAHMVLAYYPEPMAEPLILDNLITDIRPASRRPDLAPVFSFNAEGLWQGVGGSSAGDPVARLSRWRELLSKAKAEGWW
jgi:predicted transglutaminase-like cysteine proteinase